MVVTAQKHGLYLNGGTPGMRRIGSGPRYMRHLHVYICHCPKNRSALRIRAGVLKYKLGAALNNHEAEDRSGWAGAFYCTATIEFNRL